MAHNIVCVSDKLVNHVLGSEPDKCEHCSQFLADMAFLSAMIDRDFADFAEQERVDVIIKRLTGKS